MCEDWAAGSEVVNRLGDSMDLRIQSLGGLMGLIGYVPPSSARMDTVGYPGIR